MTGFSADWLALREPADHAARSDDLSRAIVAVIADGGSLGVLDLAAGTGSNLRYLAPRLSSRARWLLVDHDADLLARAGVSPGDADVETRRVDLSSLNSPPVRELFDGVTLVTASALLDLVSEPWLQMLAERCADARAAALFALSYDGRIECAPADPDDELVRGLVNAHQQTDKGFGRALGPSAAACAERCFSRYGYRVRRDRSDWVLTPESGELQRQLVDGWAGAAAEIAPAQSAVIAAWRARRVAQIVNGRSSITVGHEDFGAWF